MLYARDESDVSIEHWHKVETKILTEDYCAAVSKWLLSDEGVGKYDTLPMPQLLCTTVMYFEDAATAFAFKMRFC